jgi:hypothetical protein
VVTEGPEGWLSFKKDEIMYTDGLEMNCFLWGGTAHFPLFHTIIVLTLPFYFFKEFYAGYNAINVDGKRGRESLLFLIFRRLRTLTILLPLVVLRSERNVPTYYVCLLNQVSLLEYFDFC